ncbi:RloB family protein [Candidatus Aquiluna sp. UB-MaderosW2red]|uniref:RloB family protein n=1 Tax=Candidatus Aquiluna sp. UB-MaderosW2red TaxID=1855377 RepID=UPI000875B3D3|nr:RloB family protein [Candidatus Aquiluna sp. UB-MaderosW2red]SCX13499.1 RloB-like protein [Candidatus Aquiluna sp. UB-MaderosW2red]
MGRKRATAPARRIKRSIYIIPEGNKTEVEYINLLKDLTRDSDVTLITDPASTSTSPQALVKRATKRESETKFSEIWIIFDKDDWPPEQIEAVLRWESQGQIRHKAMSNPSFEYWLLLHFEEGRELSRVELKKRLTQHWPNYYESNKGLEAKKFDLEAIQLAIVRSRARLVSRSSDNQAGSEVHLFVEKLLVLDGA